MLVHARTAAIQPDWQEWEIDPSVAYGCTEFQRAGVLEEGSNEKASDFGMDSGFLPRTRVWREHVSGAGRVRKPCWNRDGPTGERSSWRQNHGEQYLKGYDGRGRVERERRFFSDASDPRQLQNQNRGRRI